MFVCWGGYRIIHKLCIQTKEQACFQQWRTRKKKSYVRHWALVLSVFLWGHFSVRLRLHRIVPKKHLVSDGPGCFRTEAWTCCGWFMSLELLRDRRGERKKEEETNGETVWMKRPWSLVSLPSCQSACWAVVLRCVDPPCNYTLRLAPQ